ncbi:TPA: hypothetical protein UL935_000324 [Stenotrophomonas maltophilia]|nr:hypothetical protein [Stenotrophomonas maltophilia]
MARTFEGLAAIRNPALLWLSSMRLDDYGFVALPDGTGAEWWSIDGMMEGPG